jgi:hypothetical protein
MNLRLDIHQYQEETYMHAHVLDWMHKAVWWLLVAVAVLAILFGMQGFAFAQATTPVPSAGTPIPAEEVAEDIVDATVVTAEGTADLFQGFLNRLTQTPRSDAMRVLLILGGVILLVIGWRVYDFIVLIAGFVVGATVAASLVTTDNAVIEIAAIIIGGVLGAAIGAFLYGIAVFLIGAYLGIVLTNGLAALLSLGPVSPLVLLIGGLIGGLILLGLSFEFLVIISSLVGAQMLSLGLGLDATWTLIFAVIGVILQLGLMRAYRYDFRRRRASIFRRRAVV